MSNSQFQTHNQAELKMESGPFVLARLRYRDVFTAARTFAVSGAPDPFVQYIRNGREPTYVGRLSERLRIVLYLLICIRTKASLTVNGGMSNVVSSAPSVPSDKKDITTRIAELLTRILRWSRDRFTIPEERQRRKEFEDKMGEAVKKSLGDRISKMWYVEGLCTDPLSQRRGHGGALLDAVTSLSDQLAQPTWLQSSNVANDRFYSEHGFKIVDTVLLGDEDPAWKYPPVSISIMVRDCAGT